MHTVTGHVHRMSPVQFGCAEILDGCSTRNYGIYRNALLERLDESEACLPHLVVVAVEFLPENIVLVAHVAVDVGHQINHRREVVRMCIVEPLYQCFDGSLLPLGPAPCLFRPGMLLNRDYVPRLQIDNVFEAVILFQVPYVPVFMTGLAIE